MTRFYGCYMGNHDKFYRWQCKKFYDEQEATKFAVEGSERSGVFKGTILIPVDESFLNPEFLDGLRIKSGLKSHTQVDIVHK